MKVDGDEVDFDGFDPKDGVLLEAKGPNLAKFFDEGLYPKVFFKGAGRFLRQVERQVNAAKGMRIRWVVAEEKFARALRKLFDANQYPDVEVRHLP